MTALRHARRVSLLALAAGLCGVSPLLAGPLRFVVTSDKLDAIYAVGEPITLTAHLVQDGKPVVGRPLTWVCKGDDGQETKGEAVSADEPLAVKSSLNKPGFVRLTVTLLGDDGKPFRDAGNKNETVVGEAGAGANPAEILPAPEPADFDAFWRAQLEKLAGVPVKATLAPASSKNDKVEVFDAKVDCVGDKPVSGYLAKPKGAAAKSLRAVVSFHGYGVRSAAIKEAADAIYFDVNAHGIDNGQPPEFYKALSDGPLKQYGFKGNESPEQSYFLNMLLRAKRAVDYVKSLPEWDGKNIEVTGGSQGGFQALAVAGLDADVTFVMASKPWMCDVGGVGLGRMTGWRPAMTPALAYFDPAYHVARIKTAHVLIDAGLGDYVCPPSTVTAVFNRVASADKQIVYIQGANHGTNPPGSRTAFSEYGKTRKASMR
jgi:cephalosporin-C deacetylase